jgi:hypothetical protein
MEIGNKVEFLIDTEYFTGIIKNINDGKVDVMTYMGMVNNIPIGEITKRSLDKLDVRTKFPCGDRSDFRVNSGNGDANCHRVRPTYSLKLITKNSNLCIDCVYNEK